MYVKPAYNSTLRILGDTQEAEDAVQEGFLSAFRKLDSFREEAQFSTWLTRIMINTALNKLKAAKQEWLSLKIEQDQIADPDTNWLPLQEEQLSMQQINEHVKQLPKGCRIVFTLYLLEGYDQKEIAEILEISLSTVKSQYQRARQLLQESLTKHK